MTPFDKSDQSLHDKPWFFDYEWESATLALRVFKQVPDISGDMLQRLAAEAGLKAELPAPWPGGEVVAREVAVSLMARKEFNDRAQAETEMMEDYESEEA